MIDYFKQRLSSFGYAFEGILDVFRGQANAKIHLIAAILAISGGWYFEISRTEWCLIVLCIVSVLAAESFNTALEYLTDLVSPNDHPLAKRAKDAAASGVLWVAIGALIIGILIFLPKLIK